MRVLFIESQRKLDNLDIDSINFSILPDRIFMAYSIQYKRLAETIKEKMIRLGKKVSGVQQVLGCTKLAGKEPILLIGSGRFHALNLALQDNIVYVLEGNKINKIEDKELERYRNKKKTALLKFLSSDKVGILVSCKPGQENLSKALYLKKKLAKQGKKASIFVADRIGIAELENYNIDSWVNTACKAINFDYPVLNINDIGF